MSKNTRIRELEFDLSHSETKLAETVKAADDYRRRAQVAEARIENARRYVAFPGNWSTYDGRRQTLMWLLGGRFTVDPTGELVRATQCDDTCTTDCGHCKGAGPRPCKHIASTLAGKCFACGVEIPTPEEIPDDEMPTHNLGAPQPAGWHRDPGPSTAAWTLEMDNGLIERTNEAIATARAGDAAPLRRLLGEG